MPRVVFGKLATLQLLGVRMHTTAGRELLLVRRTEPDRDMARISGGSVSREGRGSASAEHRKSRAGLTVPELQFRRQSADVNRIQFTLETRLLSLERYDAETGRATKAAIFRERQRSRPRKFLLPIRSELIPDSLPD